MLKYNEFRQMLVERIKDLLPVKYKDYVAEIYAINKINGKRDGLCLVDKGKSMSASPVIYVDELYAHYLKNGSLTDTMKKAANTVIEGFACTPTEYLFEEEVSLCFMDMPGFPVRVRRRNDSYLQLIDINTFK